MTNIVFKGKRLDNHNWVHSCLLCDADSVYVDNCPVDVETLGVSTGCLDDYDNMIYEGDIVEYSDLKGVKFTGTIVFELGSFGIATEETIPLEFTHSDNFISLSDIAWFNADVIYDNLFTCLKIIGNIHNNPQIEQNKSVKEIEENERDSVQRSEN